MNFKRKINWSKDLAYAVGLIATDGCLGRTGFLIDFTSKDIELVETFKKCLNIKAKIGIKKSGKGDISYRIQVRDRVLYCFLNDIGITPAKSKSIKKVKIPQYLYFHFLRGVFDGDGSFYSYYDKRWRSSLMFYLSFASASVDFIYWLRKTTKKIIGIKGHVTKAKGHSVIQLKYAKAESLILINNIYKKSNNRCLLRKKLKVSKILGMIGSDLL